MTSIVKAVRSSNFDNIHVSSIIFLMSLIALIFPTPIHTVHATSLLISGSHLGGGFRRYFALTIVCSQPIFLAARLRFHINLGFGHCPARTPFPARSLAGPASSTAFQSSL